MKKFLKANGFTLAEVLITLAIIGVVAAIAIPSVISNSQQTEFKTGLRKAVSVLNQAITMNMALDGETPYDNKDTYHYLQKHMAIIKSTLALPYQYQFRGQNSSNLTAGTNAAFYTTDGMRFEMDDVRGASDSIAANMPQLHESGSRVCVLAVNYNKNNDDGSTSRVYESPCGGCGSYGLSHNPNNTTKVPCLLMVDVNGDRKPSPPNASCTSSTDACYSKNIIKYPAPDSKTVSDIFAIMITEDRAVPFGVVSQKAMYQAQKK